MMYRKLAPIIALSIQLITTKSCENIYNLEKSTPKQEPYDIEFNSYYADISNQSLKNDFEDCVCETSLCVRKCCMLEFAYDPITKKCVKYNAAFEPPIWDKYMRLRQMQAMESFRFVFGKRDCGSDVRVRAGLIAEDFQLRMDGKLYVKLDNKIPQWSVLGPDKYCIDTFVYEDQNGQRTSRLDALTCFSEDKERSNYYISSACMIVSCVFIVATVVVYLWLPELRNLHGRVLVAYLLCLCVGFLFLAAMQIMLLAGNITIQICLVFTFIIYFSLQSAFFWLNIMSFDIWWTFSGKRGLSLEKLSTRGRFCAYAIYSFGIPTALTVLLAALEFSGLPPHPLLPMIRNSGCFLYGLPKLLYLYGPIVILCIANLVFFILTAVKISDIKKQTSVLKSKESAMHDQHRKDTQRLFLYIKLFIVMGINWLLEVISSVYPEAYSVWRYTDAYNVLIGLTIFVIFVCKKKILRLMKKRVKDTFNLSKPNNDELKQFHKENRRFWKNYHQQRGSQDTIRTSICADAESDKNFKVTHL